MVTEKHHFTIQTPSQSDMQNTMVLVWCCTRSRYTHELTNSAGSWWLVSFPQQSIWYVHNVIGSFLE